MRHSGIPIFISASVFAGGCGIGLVKRNDNTFPSRAQKNSFKGKGPPGPGTLGTPHSGSRVNVLSCVGMEYEKGSVSEDAWQSWMDQAANLDELGALEPFSSQKCSLAHALMKPVYVYVCNLKAHD